MATSRLTSYRGRQPRLAKNNARRVYRPNTPLQQGHTNSSINHISQS